MIPWNFRLAFCMRKMLSVLIIAGLALTAVHETKSQELDSLDRNRSHDMLKAVKDEIRKHYYDPTFHGVDLDARFKAATEKIDQAKSLAQVFGIIAQAVLDLNDSHTFFVPPPWPGRVDYGWQMQMIGDKAYVVAVKPGSDAEKKGLKPGDIVLAVDSFTPSREHVWKINYVYYALRPQQGMRLVIQKPDGQHQQLDVMAAVKQGKRILDLTGSDGGNDIADLIREAEAGDKLNRQRYSEVGKDVFIWKMPAFNLLDSDLDLMTNRFRNHKALILDLRGNGGGYEETLQRLLGFFFERDVQIGEIKRRQEKKPLVAKARNGFGGSLIVLVDSRTGSAAELFARVVQLEKRGRVVGDRTAGAVMRSKYHPMQSGTNTLLLYGASITDADLIMTDGKSLERVGVTPDEIQLPSSADLRDTRDPVISRAADLLGVKIEPEKAGSLFPVEWRK